MPTNWYGEKQKMANTVIGVPIGSSKKEARKVVKGKAQLQADTRGCGNWHLSWKGSSLTRVFLHWIVSSHSLLLSTFHHLQTFFLMNPNLCPWKKKMDAENPIQQTKALSWEYLNLLLETNTTNENSELSLIGMIVATHPLNRIYLHSTFKAA